MYSTKSKRCSKDFCRGCPLCTVPLPPPVNCFAEQKNPHLSCGLMMSVVEGEKVREAYIKFFVDKKKHDFVQSSPVVPLSDPTLLFANAACHQMSSVSSLSSAKRDQGSLPEAGMNQFKPIFLGQLEPNSPLQGALVCWLRTKCCCVL